MKATTTFRSLDRGRVRLNAQLGNVSRRAHWLPTDREDTHITTERLALHGLGLSIGVQDPSVLTAAERRVASSPTVLERAERWKQSAQAPDSLALLDLEYLDTRHGSWAGVWPYAEYFGPGFTIFPMNHREIVELITSLPRRSRLEGTFMKDIIQQQWPELLEWPVNTTPRRVRATYFPTVLPVGSDGGRAGSVPVGAERGGTRLGVDMSVCLDGGAVTSAACRG